jgi:hypothetical protein
VRHLRPDFVNNPLLVLAVRFRPRDRSRGAPLLHRFKRIYRRYDALHTCRGIALATLSPLEIAAQLE